MTDSAHAPASPAQAVAPRGLNHVVLNVRDLDVSHRFWTDLMGFVWVGDAALADRLDNPVFRRQGTES